MLPLARRLSYVISFSVNSDVNVLLMNLADMHHFCPLSLCLCTFFSNKRFHKRFILSLLRASSKTGELLMAWISLFPVRSPPYSLRYYTKTQTATKYNLLIVSRAMLSRQSWPWRNHRRFLEIDSLVRSWK